MSITVKEIQKDEFTFGPLFGKDTMELTIISNRLFAKGGFVNVGHSVNRCKFCSRLTETPEEKEEFFKKVIELGDLVIEESYDKRVETKDGISNFCSESCEEEYLELT